MEHEPTGDHEAAVSGRTASRFLSNGWWAGVGVIAAVVIGLATLVVTVWLSTDGRSGTPAGTTATTTADLRDDDTVPTAADTDSDPPSSPEPVTGNGESADMDNVLYLTDLDRLLGSADVEAPHTLIVDCPSNQGSDRYRDIAYGVPYGHTQLRLLATAMGEAAPGPQVEITILARSREDGAEREVSLARVQLAAAESREVVAEVAGKAEVTVRASCVDDDLLLRYTDGRFVP